MDITVKNKSLETIGIVDVFESLVWVERYDEPGEFELYTPVQADLVTLLQEDYYLLIPDSEKVMIIETMEIKTDVITGNKLVIKGRSLESILDRRVILQQSIFTAGVADIIWTLLLQNFISSSQPKRNVPNMIFEFNNDPLVLTPSMAVQYDGEGILDVVQEMLKKNDIGFKIYLNSSNQFVFKMYAGKDRSYNQSTNPYVVFSPAFDNLLNSSYFQSKKLYKTYGLAFGDGYYGGPRPRIDTFPKPTADYINLTGLDRRETLVDAPDLSKFDAVTGLEIPVPEYNIQLTERAREQFRSQIKYAVFDGQADITNSYKYRIDFGLGDIVQIENEFGLTARSRITEVTISENLSGYAIYPTFKKIS